MATIHITTTNPYHDERPVLRGNRIVSIGGQRYGTGLVPEGSAGRKVQHGPMVPGPWAFLVPQATIIDGTRPPGCDHLEIGDALEFDTGDRFEIAGTDARPELELTEAGR